jgi:hypothetical protein
VVTPPLITELLEALLDPVLDQDQPERPEVGSSCSGPATRRPLNVRQPAMGPASTTARVDVILTNLPFGRVRQPALLRSS